MKHFIGEKYRYPDDKKHFELAQKRGCIFYFKCGHWCTDSVFVDLIRVKTGIQVYKDNQLELFN